MNSLPYFTLSLSKISFMSSFRCCCCRGGPFGSSLFAPCSLLANSSWGLILVGPASSKLLLLLWELVYYLLGVVAWLRHFSFSFPYLLAKLSLPQRGRCCRLVYNYAVILSHICKPGIRSWFGGLPSSSSCWHAQWHCPAASGQLVLLQLLLFE